MKYDLPGEREGEREEEKEREREKEREGATERESKVVIRKTNTTYFLLFVQLNKLSMYIY